MIEAATKSSAAVARTFGEESLAGIQEQGVGTAWATGTLPAATVLGMGWNRLELSGRHPSRMTGPSSDSEWSLTAHSCQTQGQPDPMVRSRLSFHIGN